VPSETPTVALGTAAGVSRGVARNGDILGASMLAKSVFSQLEKGMIRASRMMPRPSFKKICKKIFLMVRKKPGLKCLLYRKPIDR
jgi:hypothetical protein